MASLWAFVKKRDDIVYSDKFFNADVVGNILYGLRRWPPVLIEATGLVKDFKSRPSQADPAFDLTPAFESLWIEYSAVFPDGLPGREAVSVLRIDPAKYKERGEPVPEAVKHAVSFLFWCDSKFGVPSLYGSMRIMIDSRGEIINDANAAIWSAESESYDERAAIALETLTTMNTCGTRIEPPLEKHVQVVKPDRTPCSVWRTIHLPKMPSAPLENAEISGTMLERREHWVRAHRKDYRRGAGMFGRVKALVWMPEHRRGNPELGTVKQSYEVAAR